MRVLLDNNVHPQYARLLPNHEVRHARQMGWAELENGELIRAAESDGFAVMITADKRMQYQQTIAGRQICIIVLNSQLITWPHIEPLAPQVREALRAGIRPGSFLVIGPDRGELGRP